MAEGSRDNLADLERLRTTLEGNIAVLRKSLQHWQTWDLEYESLKEELQHKQGGSSTDVLLELGKTFGGDLLNEKELKDLFGLDQNSRKTVAQVVDVVSKRQDYVRKNVQTIQKQLDTTEEKLKSVLSVTENLQDETGLPLMEIVEELDEDDNVISATVTAPSSSASQVVGALEKVGAVEKLPGMKVSSKPSEPKQASTNTKTLTPKESDAPSANGRSTDMKVENAEPKPSIKKKVSFAPDVKEASTNGESGSRRRKPDPNIAKGFFTTDKSNTRLIELDEYDRPIGSMPIIPYEPKEDAALRREMLQYGLSEVGAVVAEIDLEEGDDDDDFDDDEIYDDDVDFDDVDDSEVEEDENEYGMSTRRVITKEYAQKMAELEKKLNAHMIENFGPQPDDEELKQFMAGYTHRLVVKKDADHDAIISETEKSKEVSEGNSDRNTAPSEEIKKSEETAKKGVRFADELDISATTTSPPVPDKQAADTPTPSVTISDTIVERTSSAPPTKEQSSKPQKVSRFKSARGAKPAPSSSLSENLQPTPPRPAPQGPQGKILSANIVEHETSYNEVSPEDSELDPAFLHREATVEYHKMRNRMIQKQGGFMPTPEEEENPLYEERDGKMKKVSRFKAARLNASGSL